MSMKFENWYYHEVFQTKCLIISSYLRPFYMLCPSKPDFVVILEAWRLLLKVFPLLFFYFFSFRSKYLPFYLKILFVMVVNVVFFKAFLYISVCFFSLGEMQYKMQTELRNAFPEFLFLKFVLAKEWKSHRTITLKWILRKYVVRKAGREFI